MTKILLILALTLLANAESQYESWEEFECRAESGLSCEEMIEQDEEQQQEAETDSDEGEQE